MGMSLVHRKETTGDAVAPRSIRDHHLCSEGRNQRRIKTKQGGIKQGAGYGRRARLTLSYKQARVRLCGRSAVGLLTMSVDREFRIKLFRSKIFWWRHDPAPREREGSGRTGIYRGVYRVRLTFDSVAGSMSCRWKIAS